MLTSCGTTAYDEDGDSKHHTIVRTTKLITGMMCSLAENLKFTGEDCTQQEDSTLPTLDTALWVENGVVQHMFYEKPTMGNHVLNKETSFPTCHSSNWF